MNELNKQAHKLLGYCWHEMSCIGVMNPLYPKDKIEKYNLQRFCDGETIYRCEHCGKTSSQDWSSNEDYCGSISTAWVLIERAKRVGYHFEINTDTNSIRVFSHIGRFSFSYQFLKIYIAEAITRAFVLTARKDVNL